jgi:glucose uptake protein
MILPSTYSTAIMLTVIAIVCWGSWANTFKLTKRWRFELFYFDYAWGIIIAALVIAFTFGSMGNELSFQDNLLITGKRHLALALVAGGVFNLGNMLLVAAISIAGLTVAFPIGLGLALVVGLTGSYILHPAGNPALLFGGAFLVILAIAATAVAYRLQAETATRAKAKFSIKSVILSLIAGLLMGGCYPMVEMSRATEIGLGPYAVGVMFALGVVATTLVFNLYFMNLPIQGQPLSISSYFAPKSIRNHLLGVLGGIVWCTGAIAGLVASDAPPEVVVAPDVSYGLGHFAAVIAALWGVFAWKEFAGAGSRVRMYLVVMFVLFAAGLTISLLGLR